MDENEKIKKNGAGWPERASLLLGCVIFLESGIKDRVRNGKTLGIRDKNSNTETVF